MYIFPSGRSLFLWYGGVGANGYGSHFFNRPCNLAAYQEFPKNICVVSQAIVPFHLSRGYQNAFNPFSIKQCHGETVKYRYIIVSKSVNTTSGF